MAMTQPQYVSMLQALLPSGMAWPRDPNAVLTELLTAWSDELARFDGRIDDLLTEAVPPQVVALIPDWERVLALPDPCAANLVLSEQQRAAAIAAKFASVGGQSRAYFLGIAAALGFGGATLDEFFNVANCNGTCNDALLGAGDMFTWRLNLFGTPTVVTAGCNSSCNAQLQAFVTTSASKVVLATCNADCNAPLASWATSAILECVINRYKPAHTSVIFSYS